MQRTLNFTNRKKIEQNEALFSFTDDSGEIPEFNVQFNLDVSSYPGDASLYIEAYHKETRQRYDFGLVSNITPPENRELSELDLSGPTLFRVMIVDESGKHGLLLASGEGFRAGEGDDDDNKSSILNVKLSALGQVPWKVSFETGGMPELYLNNSIPNAIEKMRTDPVFQALVLPSAFKQVLIYYLWNRDDEEENDCYKKWMDFAALFADKSPDSEDPLDLLNWIDDVVDKFSVRFDLSDRLRAVFREDDE